LEGDTKVFDPTTLSDQELIVMQRALNEARFPVMFSDAVISGAPMLIEWHCRVIAEMESRPALKHRERKDLVITHQYLDWHRTSSEHISLISRCAHEPSRRAYFLKNGVESIRAHVAPFRIPDEIAEEILAFCRAYEHGA
jgi:hypothetical protein